MRPCVPRCGPCDRYPRRCARMYSERAKDRTCLDSTNWPRRCGPKTRTIFDRGFPSAWSTHSVLSDSNFKGGVRFGVQLPMQMCHPQWIDVVCRRVVGRSSTASGPLRLPGCQCKCQWHRQGARAIAKSCACRTENPKAGAWPGPP